MLNAQWLTAFVTFAEHLNFTHAARALSLSQPALHVQMTKLADELGVPLYRIHRRQIELTDAGVKLLAFARDAQERSAQFVNQLHTGRSQPTVTLAAGTGAYLYLLGPAIRAFTRASSARLRLLQRDHNATLDAVRSGEAHLGVAVLSALPDDLEAELLRQVDQVLVMPARHRLARRRRVRLADLDGETLIVPPDGAPQRTMLNQALQSAGVTWRAAVEATGWQLVLHFVTLGAGLTIVNGSCHLPRGLVAHPLAELPRVSYYALSRGVELGDQAERLRRLLFQHVKES